MTRLLSYSLVAIFLLSTPLQSTSQEFQQSPNVNINPAPLAQYLDRLPPNSRPLGYNLELIIDVDEWKFSGGVSIILQVIQATNKISLNARDIHIPNDTLELTDSVGNRKTLVSMNTNLFEIVEFTFLEELVPGMYTFYLDFSGNITDNLKGLYRSRYIDENGNTRYVATTFFAPNHARMVFPCYDEPEFKAVFTVSIFHNESYHALSNSKLVQSIKSKMFPGIVLSVFDTTPLMSTYLLAFVVSDFVENKNVGGSFAVFAQPDMINDTNLALNHGQVAINKLIEYLQRDYHLSKMHFVAVDDFLMGAMENWGLITYKTSRIMFNEETTSAKDFQRVHQIVTHELVHQWFGNEVTCSWWSHTWLNEGFATFLEDYITDLTNPEFGIMNQFIVTAVQYSMGLDANPDIRAMTSTVANVDQLNIIYDFIAYKKAASVIRMIQHIITPEVFQASIQHYIASNSFLATTPIDLFSSFEAIATEVEPHIHRIFSSWADNPGYPVVFIERNYITHEITATQQRFLISGPSDENLSNFLVPLNYATLEEPTFNDTLPIDYLTPEKTTVIISLNYSTDWVIFNKQQSGYYRVTYDEANWRALIAQLQLNPDKIDELNRAQLIDDSYNLAKFGYLPFNLTLDLMSYLKYEYKLVPWMSGFNALDFLNSILKFHDKYEMIEEFTHDLVRGIFKRIVSLDNSKIAHDLKLLRADVLKYACKFGLKECLSMAGQHLKNGGIEKFDVNLRPGLYYGIARTASSHNKHSEAILNRLYYILSLNGHAKLSSETELNELIDSLGSMEDDHTLEKILKMTIDDTQVNLMTPALRKQIFSSIYLSDNADEALDFLLANFISIQKHYGSLSTLIPILGGGVTSLKINSLFNNFITAATHVFTEEDREALKVGTDLAKSNLKWLNEHDRDIVQWVDHYFREIEIDDAKTDAIDGGNNDKNNDKITKPVLIYVITMLSSYFINLMQFE